MWVDVPRWIWDRVPLIRAPRQETNTEKSMPGTPIPALNTTLASMRAAREGVGSPFPSGTKAKLGEGKREEGSLNHDPAVTQMTQKSQIFTLTFLNSLIETQDRK